MRRNLILAASLLIASVGLAPSGNAKLLDAYDLVGEDKNGDALNPVATGVDNPSTTFSRGKQDIVSLQMGQDAESLHIKLNLAALYHGTSSLIFAVHVKVGGKPYFTCWNINSAGTTTMSNDVAENTLGCSRFSGTTQVGPATRAAGVSVGTGPDKNNSVRWEVPKAAIGKPAADAEITDIVAETWVRGVSTCCVGSTAQSPYMWNLADRAPDKGTWSYSLAPKAPAAPPLSLSLTAASPSASAAPAATATFDLTAALSGDGTVKVGFNASGLPDGFSFAFEPPTVDLSGDGSSATTTLTIQVPADADNQTVEFEATASAAGNLTAAASLVLVVESSAAAPPPKGEPSPETATEEAGARSVDEEAQVPGPGVLAVLAAAAIGVLGVRRRRAH